jgi:hypothetical protein
MPNPKILSMIEFPHLKLLLRSTLIPSEPLSMCLKLHFSGPSSSSPSLMLRV